MVSRKVLVVEDDKMLSTIFRMFLTDLGHELVGFYTTGKEAIEKCEEVLPDVILMDIHLSGEIDGITTVEIIQEKYNIPVIYISGDTEKETINRALQTKSYGYLIKPIDKTELGINIELACLKHKYIKDIHIRERRYRNLVDVSPSPILVIVDDIIEYVNFSGLRLFETIHIENLLEKNFFDFIPETYHSGLRERFNELLSDEKSKIEFSPAKITSLNDKTYNIGILGNLIEFKNTKAIQLIISDHTEYIETKKLLTEQNNIINNVHDGVITISLSGNIMSWNSGAERIYGKTKDDVIGKSFGNLFPEKDDMFLQEVILEETLEKRNHEIIIDRLAAETKEKKYLQLSLSILTNLGNEITGIVCYTKDITERKLEHEAMIASQTYLKAIFDGSTEAIFFIDDAFDVVDFNRLARQYAEKFFDKVIEKNKPILDLLSFIERSEFEHLFFNTVKGKISHHLERSFDMNDKRYFFKITIYPIVNSDHDTVSRFCISFLDITDKKRTERELAETHAELKPLFDSSIQRFYLADLEGKLVAFNKSAKEIIQKEFKRNLKKGDSLFDFIPEEIGEEEFKRRFKLSREGKHITFMVKLTNETETYWAEAHLDPIKDETGETKRVLFWTLDVTDREESLSLLQKSEERYSLVASGGNDGLWDWDMTSNELYVSPRWKSMLGFEPEEQVTREGIKETILHPEDIESARQTLKKYLKGEVKIYQNEYRVKHRKGHYKWILERGVALWDESGKPYRMAGSISDITDRKKAEEELREANHALLAERRMFIKGNVVIFRVKLDDFTNIQYVSENVAEVFGYTQEDFVKEKVNFTSLIHSDDYEMHENERKKAIDLGNDHIDFTNYRLVRKDGKIIWVKDSTSILKDEQGNPTELLGYIVDITKEIQAEKGLIENQQKYYSLFSKASDAILIIDDDQVLDCNDKAVELFGYDRSELLGSNLLEHSPELQTRGETSAEKRVRKLREIQDGKSDTFHWIYKRKDGSHFDAEVSIAYVELKEKKYLHAIIRDITERIEIQKKVEENEQKHKMLISAIPDTIFLINKQGKYIDYRPDSISGLDIPKEEVIGKDTQDFFEEPELTLVHEKINLALKDKKVHSMVYEMMSPKGKRKFEARLTAYKEDVVLMLARDVTE